MRFAHPQVSLPGLYVLLNACKQKIFQCPSEDTEGTMASIKSKEIKLSCADWITLTRAVGAVVLFFLKPLSVAFFIVYSLCGISDALDGWVARRTGTASEFGSKLDSMADLLFYAAMLLRLLPVLFACMPGWFWYGVILVLALRLGAYLLAAFKYRRFASLHTYGNKLTGFAIFVLPYLMKTPLAVGSCITACAIACLASLEELLIHLLQKEYCPQAKTIFRLHAGSHDASTPR